MALPTCPACGSDDLRLIADLEDGRKHLKCGRCGHDWKRGEAKRVAAPVPSSLSISELKSRFSSTSRVETSARARAEQLKREYLKQHPSPGARETEFRSRYRALFSKAGLPTAIPQDLKDFANANVGGNPGNMSVFNTAWNEMGAEEAARKVRESIDHLLYGPESRPPEDRLTDLIEGPRGLGMKGFREALLTKVLCMVFPDRFIPILTYTGRAGKKEVAEWVHGLRLPKPEQTTWTRGRLIYWSNDLLLALAGDGFTDMEHVAEFLWWAKDRARGTDR